MLVDTLCLDIVGIYQHQMSDTIGCIRDKIIIWNEPKVPAHLHGHPESTPNKKFEDG